MCLGRPIAPPRRAQHRQKTALQDGAEIAWVGSVMSLTPSISDPTIDPAARFSDFASDSARPPKDQGGFWGEDGMRFGDLLDTINPLQHIPGVSTVYRALTGDTISPASRIAGGGLFGGPIGFLSGLFNTVVEGATGRDVGGHMLAMLPGRNPPADSVQIASANPSSGNQSADTIAAANEPGARAAPIATPDDTTKGGGNLGALAALARDLRAVPPEGAMPASANADALAALRGDLAAARGKPRNEVAAVTQAHSVRGAQPNLFTAALPPPSSTDSGPTRPDGRKPGEYSAAELASIFRSYQRAAEAAGPIQDVRSPRVED